MTDVATALDLRACTLKMLDVSTAYIPEHTAKALGSGGFDDNPYTLCQNAELWDYVSYTPWSQYGWIFYTSEDQEGAAEEHGHPELCALLKFARLQGFDFIKLDCDGVTLPEEAGFKEFDW
jgi:hypothetical protein